MQRGRFDASFVARNIKECRLLRIAGEPHCRGAEVWR